jgi:hypothetical protein
MILITIFSLVARLVLFNKAYEEADKVSETSRKKEEICLVKE